MPNYEKQISELIKTAGEQYQDIIAKFDYENKAREIKPISRWSYIVALKNFTNLLAQKYRGKKLEKVTKQDLIDWINYLQDEQHTFHTINAYKVRIKKFYQWLYKKEEREYPEIVKWIKAKRANNNFIEPSSLLTDEEVKKLIDVADNPRDRALLDVLYETGCRASEILTLKVKSVTFDRYGAVIFVYGKTGQRRLRLVDSAPTMQLWYNAHPKRDDPEAPLWIIPYKGTVLSYSALYKILGILKERAGIKKHINPHLFRHTRMTKLAGQFTEQELKVMAGWTRDSKMAAVYVHLTGVDIEEKYLKVKGVKKEEIEKMEEPKQPKTCSRCGYVNFANARFCNQCSMALDLKATMELEEKQSEVAKGFIALASEKPNLLEDMQQFMEVLAMFQQNLKLWDDMKKAMKL